MNGPDEAERIATHPDKRPQYAVQSRQGILMCESLFGLCQLQLLSPSKVVHRFCEYPKPHGYSVGEWVTGFTPWLLALVNLIIRHVESRTRTQLLEILPRSVVKSYLVRCHHEFSRVVYLR